MMGERSNMKLIFRFLIMTGLAICLSIIGCTNKESYDYLSKDVISLQDIEKLFKNDGIKLVSKGLDKSEFFTLQQKHSTVYFINNDREKVLKVYLFSSEDERIKGRAEYSEKTALTSMVYHEVYGRKNIMIILAAGDKSNKYYSKVRLAIEKIDIR